MLSCTCRAHKYRTEKLEARAEADAAKAEVDRWSTEAMAAKSQLTNEINQHVRFCSACCVTYCAIAAE